MSGPWEAYSEEGAKPWEAYGQDSKKTGPQTPSEAMVDAAKKAYGMLSYGNPLSLITGAAKFGMQKGDELLGRAAYNIGGGATDLAAKTGMPPEYAAGIGTAANVATQAVPAYLTGAGAGKLLQPVGQYLGRHLMQSALKPGVTPLLKGDAGRAVETLLQEGINVTPGGVTKLRGKIEDINQTIADAIANSSAVVNKARAASPLSDVEQKFMMQVSPQSDLAKIQSVGQQFSQHPLAPNQADIPVQLAQKLKQGTYKVLHGKYGEIGSAETEAQKAIARGLKDEIASVVPGISGLNAAESRLINALEPTERRALLSWNNNPGGLAWLTHDPKTWAAFIADKSPLFKSLVSRMLYSGAERIPQAAASVGMAGAEGILSEMQRKKIGVLDQGE